MFKKITALMLCGALAASFSGCAEGSAKNTDKLSIVCTIFPEYDWVRQILGSHADDAQITYLLDSGADLHNYQPTAADMVKITTCDLFIYAGGESDHWVEDALSEAENKDIRSISLLETLGDLAKEEELIEGMEPEEEEEEEAEEEGPEYDEHVWLSLRNAQTLCTAITDQLCQIKPELETDLRSNCDSYNAQLDELDGKFSLLFDDHPDTTLIFGDRFPFRYFVDDYGVDYYAAFVGCSAETEASFDTVTFLAGKLEELDPGVLFTLEGSDQKIAETIISNSAADAQIAELDSIQSVNAQQISDGASYLSLMEKNYETLKEVLK
ncbi:MAG: zinc ABC transporter substrate-binding protein [Ruminococcus sp.]|nr:zinc ABC transporter substrate-binding protein [Ruminococcus sp.]